MLALIKRWNSKFGISSNIKLIFNTMMKYFPNVSRSVPYIWNVLHCGADGSERSLIRLGTLNIMPIVKMHWGYGSWLTV